MSTVGFLMSLLARPEPGGIPYDIGERAWAGVDVTATLVAGTGGSADTGAWAGVETGAGTADVPLGSGSDLGKMCFSRLFL